MQKLSTWWVSFVVFRSGHREKGGRSIGIDLSPELTDQLAETVVVVAELLGDLFLREAIEEDCSQSFVLTLVGVAGLGKKLAVVRIVHNRCSVKM